MTDAAFETALWTAWRLGCLAAVTGLLGLIFRNQIVRAWRRARHIPAYIANHRLIKESPMAETEYEGRHRWHTGLTGLFPLVQLPLDPTTVVVDSEVVADQLALFGAERAA